MENTLNTNTVVQSASNKIVGMKSLIRSVVYLVIFLTGFGIGLFIGSGQASMARQGITGENLLTNPNLSSITVQGTLKSKSAKVVILEKNGKELILNMEGDVPVTDIKSLTQANAEGGSSMVEKKIKDIEIGTNLTGSAVFVSDKATSKAILVVKSFIIN